MSILIRIGVFIASSVVSAAVVSALKGRGSNKGVRSVAPTEQKEPELEQVPKVADLQLEPLHEKPLPTDSLLSRMADEGVTLDELEKAYIIKAMEGVEGNRTRAAEMLGIARRTLYRKLKDCGLLEEDK